MLSPFPCSPVIVNVCEKKSRWKKKCKNILFMQIPLVSSGGMLVNNEAKYKLAITILLA